MDLSVFNGAPKVEVDDKVVVNVEKKIMKIMQLGHGGWQDDMEKYLNRKGKVVKIDADDDVEVKFSDDKTVIFNPNVVAKILRKGDTVQITKNEQKAEFLQRVHGGWNSRMKKILGEKAKVKHIFKTYDATVKVKGDTWCLNPLLCTVIKKNEDGPSSDEDSDDEMFKMFNRVAKEAMDQLFQVGMPGLKEIIYNSDIPENAFLHFCVYNENQEMTETILTSGFDIDKTDEDGDTALHIAVMRKNSSITRLLVSKGARKDIQNKNKQTPLHIAVFSGCLKCIEELKGSPINIKVCIKSPLNDIQCPHKADECNVAYEFVFILQQCPVCFVRWEDENGHTPVMLAIIKGDHKILKHLLTYEKIDLEQQDKQGFSPVHIATAKRDVKSVEMLLLKKPDMVDLQKDDGYSALHLAALNDVFDVARYLLEKANAKVDLKTHERSTPLLLAASTNNLKMIELLLSYGADIDAQNQDGNTSLHVSIHQKIEPRSVIERLMRHSHNKSSNAVDVVIYLVEHGANLYILNKEKKMPLDMIDSDKLRDDLLKRAKSSAVIQEKNECILCLENMVLVKFKPCGHMKLCPNCNNLNKSLTTCMQCKKEITDRIIPDTEVKKMKYSRKSLFKNGDQVFIIMNKDLLIKREGNKDSKLTDLLREVGTVLNMEESDKIHVIFDDQEYNLLPEMLSKAFMYRDEVQLHDDIELVKILQKDHGGWTEEMKEIIGKTGEVMQVERKKIKVKFGTECYALNPLACDLLKKPEQEIGADSLGDRCINCKQKTVNMITLQCSHMLCSGCKYLGKCTSC